MTKFILHGGDVGRSCESNDKFYKEMLDSVPDPVKILIVPFAREHKDWDELLSDNQLRLVARAGERSLHCALASEDQEDFFQQLKNSNVIYLADGNAAKLQAQLGKIAAFKDLLKDKLVVGISAGALVLTKFYYDSDTEEITAGLGIINAKLVTHYSPKLQNEFMRLSLYKEDLPVYQIPDAEYMITAARTDN